MANITRRRLTLFLALTVLGFYSKQASAQPIDPFIYLQPLYVENSFTLTLTLGLGNIVGADAILNNGDFAILYDTGFVEYYHEGATIFYDRFLSTGSTGITEVPNTYPGPLAISEVGSVLFYDYQGTFVSETVVATLDITDISYDAERDRIIVATLGNGINELHSDGSLTQLITSNGVKGIEIIDMESNPLTFDMLQRDSTFNRFDLVGNIPPVNGSTTNLAHGGRIHGIAFTNNTAIMAIPEGFFTYPKLAFQDHLQAVVLIPGDMNCDGVVDPLDVAPYALALTDPTAYLTAHPNCHLANADTNGDGTVNGLDTESFVVILLGG